MGNVLNLINRSIVALEKTIAANNDHKPGPSATTKAKDKWKKDQLELQELVDALNDQKRVHGKQAWVCIQEGGSSSEVYVNASDSEAESNEFIASCEEGAYRTAGPIMVPPHIAIAGEELYSVIEEILQAAAEEF